MSFGNKYNIMTVNDFEIYFNGNIYTESMFELVREIKKCESKILEMEKNKNPFGEDMKTPIRLHIFSHGGTIVDSFFAADQIRMLKVPIHTIICGLGCSGATVISCVGTWRYITKNSHMMIHKGGIIDPKLVPGNDRDAQWHGANWYRLLVQHYVQYTKMTDETIEEIFSLPDRYMSPEECLAKGLVDEIIWNK